MLNEKTIAKVAHFTIGKNTKIQNETKKNPIQNC